MCARSSAIIQEDLEAIASANLPWDRFSGRTILVTGAAGFLPAYMVELLLFLNRAAFEKPARVVALVRSPERAKARFEKYLGRDDFKIIHQDVSDPLSLGEPFDYVIHAASQASPKYYRVDPVGTLSANVLGTYHLLKAAQDRELQGFLFFSSGEAYGALPPGIVSVAEDEGGFLDPTDFRSCYGESKRMGETMCAAWFEQFKIPTHIVRPFHTYGPGMRLDDGRVFADFVRDILKGGPIVLKSDGSARRSFCYLADATLGFFTVLLLGRPGEAYNVASPDGECTIAELAERLALDYQAEGITVTRAMRIDATYVPSAIKSAVPNVEKLLSLGWRGVWGLEQGFRRTIDSYR